MASENALLSQLSLLLENESLNDEGSDDGSQTLGILQQLSQNLASDSEDYETNSEASSYYSEDRWGKTKFTISWLTNDSCFM